MVSKSLNDHVSSCLETDWGQKKGRSGKTFNWVKKMIKVNIEDASNKNQLRMLRSNSTVSTLMLNCSPLSVSMTLGKQKILPMTYLGVKKPKITQE